jgi:hypothetical protein
MSKNWQGKMLVAVQTAVDFIGAPTTTTGLTVICVCNDSEYELTKKGSNAEFETVNLTKIAPFGAWNYYILPHHQGQLNY